MDIAGILAIARKHALLLVLGPLTAGLATLAITFFLPPIYESEAKLAIVKSGAVVNFDPKYKTVSELDAANIDQAARRKSLLTLAKGGALATAVIGKLGDRLNAAEHVPTNLLNLVEANIDGDLVSFKVKSSDAAKATLIANTWSESYMNQINQIYGEDALTADDLGTQVASAKRDFDMKESALVNYLTNNPIDQLTRQITQKQQRLNDLVTLETKLEHLLDDTTALQDKMSGGGTNARGDELATLLLEASTFSTWANLPVSLQIPIDQLSAGTPVSDQLRSLNTLKTILQARRTEVQMELDGPLQKEINTLQAALEQANAQKQTLTRDRDISLSAVTTLSNKLAEVQIAAQSRTSVVRIAQPAVIPDLPVGRWINVAIATFAGLLLSVTAIFTMEFAAR